MKIEEIKKMQFLELKEKCIINGVCYESMIKLLDSEKVKKLQKRNHFIQQTIDCEIEKTLEYENK